MDLAILVTAREYDEQFDWSINELAAREDGLEPAIIEIVRERKPLSVLGEKEALIVKFGRELFGQHFVTAETYARALDVFGERDLVDFVDVDGAAFERRYCADWFRSAPARRPETVAA